jgi:hypothetical protein
MARGERHGRQHLSTTLMVGEVGPESLGFAGTDRPAEDLAAAVGVHRGRDALAQSGNAQLDRTGPGFSVAFAVAGALHSAIHTALPWATRQVASVSNSISRSAAKPIISHNRLHVGTVTAVCVGRLPHPPSLSAPLAPRLYRDNATVIPRWVRSDRQGRCREIRSAPSRTVTTNC